MGREQIELNVESVAGGDEERAADLAWHLQRWLLEADLEPRAAGDGRSAEGAKGAALDWAQLAVSATGGLPFLVQLIRDWRGRTRDAKVTLSFADDQLILEGADQETEQRLVDVFLAAHASGG